MRDIPPGGCRCSPRNEDPPQARASGAVECVGTGGQRMSREVAAGGGELSLTGNNLTYVIIAAVIALVALGFALALTRTVLAAGRGTNKMQEIAAAVQEGAAAYLVRQFKTLGIFVVIAVVLLFLLPVAEAGS